MGLFDSIRNAAQGSFDRFNNGAFADASMAICALIAAADGEVEAEEIKKTRQFIAKYDKLAAFDRQELAAKFANFCNDAVDDFDRMDLLDTIGKLKGRRDQAIAAVQVGVLVANSDGEFEPEEVAVVREVCSVLNLDPTQFGA